MGYLDIIKYLHENGVDLDPYTCSHAATYGRLDCLKYAHENGCACNSGGENATYWAAQNGHLECLRYAHKNGCEWSDRVCEGASLQDRLDCFMYAIENGAPLNLDKVQRGTKCYKYAQSLTVTD